MYTELLLGIDAGTTAIKVAAYDTDGRSLARSTVPFELETPSPQRVELEAELYWANTCTALRDVVRQLGKRSREIRALAVSSQGETFVALDERGKALRKAIVWLDNRAVEEAARIRRAFATEAYYATTGLPTCEASWESAKILWLREHEPEVFRRAASYLLVHDFILYRLTGRRVTEPSVSFSNGFMDFRGATWWREMVEFVGIRLDQLPEPMLSGALVGALTPAAAAETGLSTATEVYTGALDQICGAVGAGNIAPGLVTECSGTALALVAVSNDVKFDPKRQMPVVRHPNPGRYCLLPYSQTAAVVLEWFRDNFAQGEAFDRLVQEAMRVEPGAEGLVCLPHLAGSTTPIFNPHARGVFSGFTLRHSRAHFVRAILESVGFMLREHIENLRTAGLQVGKIRSIGGGARSDDWLQIKADICQLPIERVEEDEAATLGAAVIAGVGAGVLTSFEAAVESLIRVADRIEPRSELGARYNTAFRAYREAFDRLYDLPR